MNVKQLIKELRKMPSSLEVGVSMHDNQVIAGYVFSIDHFIKADCEPDRLSIEERDMVAVMQDECVIIRC